MHSTQIMMSSTVSKYESKSEENDIHPLVNKLIDDICSSKLDSEEEITMIKILIRTISELAAAGKAININAQKGKYVKTTALMSAVKRLCMRTWDGEKWVENSPIMVKGLSEIIDELLLAKANVNIQQQGFRDDAVIKFVA